VIFRELIFSFLKHSEPYSTPLSLPLGTNYTKTTATPTTHAYEEPNHSWPTPSLVDQPSSFIPPLAPPSSYTSSPVSPSPSSPPPPPPLPELHRFSRLVHPLSYLADYRCNSSFNLLKSPSPTTSHPLSFVLTYHRLSQPHRRYLMTLSVEFEPTSYKEAIFILAGSMP